jgi:hypothetical protein
MHIAVSDRGKTAQEEMTPEAELAENDAWPG